jgi:hypothetical protein
MDTPEEKQVRINKISTILNYVGGTLIFLGLVYLLERNWGFVAAVIRDVFTLAIACWAILTASRQTTQNRATTSTGALFLFGGFLLPMGLYSVAGSLGLLQAYSDLTKIFVPAICFIIFLCLQLRHQRDILLFLCVFFATTCFITTTDYLFNAPYGLVGEGIIKYQALALGFGYILLAGCLSSTHTGFTGLLVFVGDLLVLIASFYIAGLLFYNFDNISSETGLMLAPLVILFSFLLYIPFKNKSLVLLSVLFLLIYLRDLITKFAYLFGSLGWPFVLIVTGILFMVIAYALVHKQKK